MKLLFDQNLSPRLVNMLADLFPESDHVFSLGLDRSPDLEIREYARQNAFTIVTRSGFVAETLQQLVCCFGLSGAKLQEYSLHIVHGPLSLVMGLIMGLIMGLGRGDFPSDLDPSLSHHRSFMYRQAD